MQVNYPRSDIGTAVAWAVHVTFLPLKLGRNCSPCGWLSVPIWSPRNNHQRKLLKDCPSKGLSWKICVWKCLELTHKITNEKFKNLNGEANLAGEQEVGIFRTFLTRGNRHRQVCDPAVMFANNPHLRLVGSNLHRQHTWIYNDIHGPILCSIYHCSWECMVDSHNLRISKHTDYHLGVEDLCCLLIWGSSARMVAVQIVKVR